MAVYSISVACEQTVLNYITGSMTGSLGPINYYTGVNNEDKDAPAVIVSARVGNEVVYGTNVYSMEVSLLVKEMAADTNKADIGVLAANVFNVFYDPARTTNFTNTSIGFATFQVQPGAVDTEVDADTMVNKFTATLIGCLIPQS